MAIHASRADSASASIHLTIRDPAHLEAHRRDFLLPLETVLDIVRQALAAKRVIRDAAGLAAGEVRWECFAHRCPRTIGKSGLAAIRPWTRGDWWGRRPGRERPSHLIAGQPRLTRKLCIWGFWEGDGHFVIHTLYPGLPAPREIHDPELPLAELPAAIRFWTRHAIIVEQE